MRMRVFPVRTAVLLLSLAPLTAQVPTAHEVLRATREALGGEKMLTSITSFTASGRTRQLRGNNLVPIEFEITVQLPDKYVRTDEFPAQDTDPTTQGFVGETLIQFPAQAPARGTAPPPTNGRGEPPLNPTPARVVAVKQDFARLTLGLFAASFSAYPVTFTYATQADAPEGKADVLGVAGPGNFSAQLVIQRDTHLPVLLMWQVAGRGAAAPTDTRLYYGDFRKVDGVTWPYRLRRAVAGQTVEETMFDRFRLNPKIDPKKFEAPK